MGHGFGQRRHHACFRDLFFIGALGLGLLTTGQMPCRAMPQTQSIEVNEKTETVESPESSEAEPSDAERVAALREALEQDREQLAALEAEFENPNSEYALAEKDYRSLHEEHETLNNKIEEARAQEPATAIERMERELGSLARQMKLAEDRFDLAIEDRKTQREERATLKRKIERDTEALDALIGERKEGENSQDPKKVESNDKAENSKENNATHNSDSKSDASNKSQSEEEESIDDEELKKATEVAHEKEEQAKQAQEETRSIATRLADIQKLVTQEQKELDLAKKRVELASAAQLTLTQELERRQNEQADPQEIQELKTSIGQANQRLVLARLEVTEISERLNDHRAEQSHLQSEHILALHEMEQKRREAESATQVVESLRNPFTVRNILNWIIEHGPRLLAIVVGMFLLNRLACFFAFRSVQLVTSGTSRGSTVERENRAKTLVGVFQNAATVAIFVGGGLMILEEVGANITVLMGGVAVIGLAVAFGAQNLIKDYFYGFVMLLENQYMLNDSVKIGGVSGQVERITLRVTVLRDSNGVVHFIPNGTINSVSNETHGWSRAVCEIAVSTREDIQRVVAVLRDVSQELVSDRTLGGLILDVPSEPAIESLGESAIHLKVAVKTLPNKHGLVKQDWLRRIKKRFDELGIEPPVQHRVVRIHSDSHDPSSVVNDGQNRHRLAG